MSSNELLKEIRDELRMTAAMRCYSILRTSGSKSLTAQYDYMSSLFHGDEPSIPSNIKLLCEGSYVYKDLYDIVEDEAVVSRSSIQNTECRSSLSLKVSLSCNKSRVFFAGKHIVISDMEKKGRNGQQLVSGRNIYDMAKRGTANYRKALSFATKKFDLDSMIVKESGSTIDDVIEYVRVEMYQQHIKQDNIKKKTVVIDGDEDDTLDDNKDLEDEYLSSIKNQNVTESKKTNVIFDNANNVQSAALLDEKLDKKGVSNTDKQKSFEEKKKIKKKATNKDSDIIQKIMPPPHWFFPSWFSFIAYGPFVSKDKRLPLLEITDASKKIVKSRAEKRKAEKVEKDSKRVNDSITDRGFSTDQKMQLEIIDLTRQQTNDRSRESVFMGLCVQEAALTKQIDRAERMAERLAPNDVDNPQNKWWNKVNSLIEKQERIIIQMADLNKDALKNKIRGYSENSTSDIDNNPLTNMSTVLPSLVKAVPQVEITSDLSKDTEN